MLLPTRRTLGAPNPAVCRRALTRRSRKFQSHRSAQGPQHRLPEEPVCSPATPVHFDDCRAVGRTRRRRREEGSRHGRSAPPFGFLPNRAWVTGSKANGAEDLDTGRHLIGHLAVAGGVRGFALEETVNGRPRQARCAGAFVSGCRGRAARRVPPDRADGRGDHAAAAPAELHTEPGMKRVALQQRAAQAAA